MTQIGMLGNDEAGNVVYGDSEGVIVKDMEITTKGVIDKDQTTTYNFVLKNNVRFSNGTYLTIKDVLFNLYVYLDPVYTGSATLYSTDIVGLKEYRTQESDEKEQLGFQERFQNAATARINALADACESITDEHNDLTEDSFLSLLNEYKEQFTGTDITTYDNIVKDYQKALELFKEELENDYSNSIDSYEDVKFYDENGKVYEHLFTTDVESFLYNEGYVSWSKKDAKLSSSLVKNPEDLKSWTKAQAIEKIWIDKIPQDIQEIILYWATSTNLNTYIVNEEMEIYYSQADARKYKNISGIKYANKDESVIVNGIEYKPVHENSDGTIDGNQVLSITINDVDPKAIWNFAIGVAPMYYYSNEEQIRKFDYVENFGVEYASQTFMENVVKDPKKIGVPVGAGYYAASKIDGGIENIQAGDFLSRNVVYFERNPYFVLGPAKIKKVRFQVVNSSQINNSLYSGEIDFAEPNAKPETISELNSKKDEGIGNTSIRTSGYGYIGINAGKVQDIKVRQAIMHAINTQETVNYYRTTAVAIYRAMSKSSWAYPKNATAYYPYIGDAIPENLSVVNPDYADYIAKVAKTRGTTVSKMAGQKLTEQEQKDFLIGLIEDAGYTKNSSGIYAKGSTKLEFTFTVAGEETDHPAWSAMWHAGELLNKIGMNITVQTDANALKKLSSGALTVWAAAWGSTIDPDMYQVYHKESKATSVLNWGYKQILQNVGNKYEYENRILDDLSDLIDQGRHTNDQAERTAIYSDALDLVMKLAVELPTYQRDDLFAYNTNKIDVNTFNKNTSSYKGLTADLNQISLVVEK